jgi:hypothetical protein
LIGVTLFDRLVSKLVNWGLLGILLLCMKNNLDYKKDIDNNWKRDKINWYTLDINNEGWREKKLVKGWTPLLVNSKWTRSLSVLGWTDLWVQLIIEAETNVFLQGGRVSRCLAVVSAKVVDGQEIFTYRYIWS